MKAGKLIALPKKSQIEVRLTCARVASDLPAAATALGFVLFYGNEGYP